jgi:hypothetical protein
MNKSIKAALFAIALISTLPTIARTKLEFYKCINMQGCTTECTKQNRQALFLVDKKKSIIKMNVYENGSLARSILFEKCKAIFNDENWDCSDETQFNTGIIKHTKQMNDSIYYSSDIAYSVENTVPQIRKISEICAR